MLRVDDTRPTLEPAGGHRGELTHESLAFRQERAVASRIGIQPTRALSQHAPGRISLREKRLRLGAAQRKMKAIVAVWKKVGEEFQGPLIVTGSVLFTEVEKSGMVSRPQQYIDETGNTRYMERRSYSSMKGFALSPTFVFIDGLDEVTDFFKGVEDITEAVHRVNTEADVVWVDGHSDYGHAFEVFWERYGKDVGPKTTVLLLGDARNNYHAAQSWVVKEIRHKARHVYWLNPEPRSYWNTGDSIVGEYAVHTDGVYEVRNLRQLEAFVEKLA